MDDPTTSPAVAYDALRTFVSAFGLDPADLPATGGLWVSGGKIMIETLVRDQDGRIVPDPSAADSPARRLYAFEYDPYASLPGRRT